jgi:hypothetical protein
MIPDACPYCGAPIYAGVVYPVYACRTTRTRNGIGEGITFQSPECARYVRTRISQLKRMADIAFARMQRFRDVIMFGYDQDDRIWCSRHRPKYKRLFFAAKREIDRLKAAQP